MTWRIGSILLAVCLIAVTVRAQITVEEAYERLRARKAEADAASAATQPAATTAPAEVAPEVVPAATQEVAVPSEDVTTAPTTSTSTGPLDAKTLTDAEIDDLHAQAVVLMRANRFDRAKPLLEKAIAAKPLSRQSMALVTNYCLIDVKQRVPMRAVKTLMEFFRDRSSSSSEALSEKPVNLLAIALASAVKQSPRVTTTPLFKDASARFIQLNSQLEAARPGYKRWGTQWISPDEYAQKKLAVDDAQAEFEKAQEELKRCAQDVDYAKAEYARAKSEVSPFTYRTTAQSQALASTRDTITYAEQRYQRQQQLVEKARRAIPMIPWPESMEPVEP